MITSKSPSKPPTPLPALCQWMGGGQWPGQRCSWLRRRLSSATLAVTGASMVLGAAFSLLGLVMALRILCQEGNPRGRTTSAVFFLCGETVSSLPPTKVPQVSTQGPGE